MSDQPSLSRGGMSPEGRTNPVGTLEPRLDPQDKKVLCSAVCHCSSTPNLSQDGKSLKQVCVAQRPRERNDSQARCDNRSESQQAANPGQYQTGGGDEISA